MAPTSAILHTTSLSRPEAVVENPLPQLLHTPSGLALLELQGTINIPDHHECDAGKTDIGRLEFPFYDPEDRESMAWMKRVYLYVGKHQRLTGEVKKLPRAIAVIRKRAGDCESHSTGKEHGEGMETQTQEELEIVEIVKWKIMFSTRPEPVGTLIEGD